MSFQSLDKTSGIFLNLSSQLFGHICQKYQKKLPLQSNDWNESERSSLIVEPFHVTRGAIFLPWSKRRKMSGRPTIIWYQVRYILQVSRQRSSNRSVNGTRHNSQRSGDGSSEFCVLCQADFVDVGRHPSLKIYFASYRAGFNVQTDFRESIYDSSQLRLMFAPSVTRFCSRDMDTQFHRQLRTIQYSAVPVTWYQVQYSAVLSLPFQ
jgi:hypothetical protein